MIKLKIGDNYLITTPKDPSCSKFIQYMMSCYNGKDRVAVGLCPRHATPNGNLPYQDILSFIRENRLSEVDFVYDQILYPDVVRYIKSEMEGIKIRFVKITKENLASRKFKIAKDIYETLRVDNDSILSHLTEIDEYRPFANRFKLIPDELKVINENLVALEKKRKEARPITLKDLEYLNLIEKVELNGENLRLHIKPLNINPSEPLGKVYDKATIEKYPYLYEVCKQIYLGNHFRMPGTIIEIPKDFNARFIETKDKRWDRMFKNNNWSTIGYPHFGVNHFCQGEFADTIAHATEYGLEYYFLCLKQYLTTANMRDIAGVKILWYPIYDENDNIVYCAGMEAYKNAYRNRFGNNTDIELIPERDYIQLSDFANCHSGFGDLNIEGFWRCPSGYNKGEDAFLALCKEKEPEVYEEIMKKGSR